MINSETLIGIMIPLIGTAAGGACVFFMKGGLNTKLQKILSGFAAGVMVAASIWSLIIPAMEQSSDKGRLAFLPAFTGFWIGVVLLMGLDNLIPHMHIGSEECEGPACNLTKTTMMVLAVVLHNIPEGMAVGVVYAGALTGSAKMTLGGALALSLGIAIQNFPEGAIVSMPLYAAGKSKSKAFWNGFLSGAVEPIAAFLTILAAEAVVPAMPYLLSLAAGAMMYVVVEELIPEMAEGEHSHAGVLMFAAGFTVMMALDVALG